MVSSTSYERPIFDHCLYKWLKLLAQALGSSARLKLVQAYMAQACIILWLKHLAQLVQIPYTAVWLYIKITCFVIDKGWREKHMQLIVIV